MSVIPSVAIESHVKRLAQPLSEIRMLLDALKMIPISEAVRRVADIGDVKLHPQSVDFGERLSLLVRKAVEIVEREQAKTESTSRNVSLFLQEWRDHTEALFAEVRFFESTQIRVRDELVVDATLLREVEWGAYVSTDMGHLSIYMSDDLLAVFDAIADQLISILRFDLLPAGLRDDITSLVNSNLARLGNQQFGAYLNQRLREKGFPVGEDQELQRIVQSATQDIEAQVQVYTDENAVESDSGTEGASTFSPDHRGAGIYRPDELQSKLPPQILTAQEVLGKLPKIDESSFGSGSIVDLSGTSQWQIRTHQLGPEPGEGGGSGGGGGFRNAQAYRDAYGMRGEEWVVELEKQALLDAGRPDLAESVFHKSKSHEGSPWDIESFDKSYPHRAIYVEVKSTSETDNFEVDMSVEQIRAALRSSRPYYLYRVVDVHTSKPTAYIYDFKKIADRIKFSATNVSVMLPRPKESDQ